MGPQGGGERRPRGPRSALDSRALLLLGLLSNERDDLALLLLLLFQQPAPRPGEGRERGQINACPSSLSRRGLQPPLPHSLGYCSTDRGPGIAQARSWAFRTRPPGHHTAVKPQQRASLHTSCLSHKASRSQPSGPAPSAETPFSPSPSSSWSLPVSQSHPEWPSESPRTAARCA